MKTTPSSVKPKSSPSKANYTPIIVGVILLVVLVGISVYFGFSSYGKAIAPSPSINLDVMGTDSFPVETAPTFKIEFTPTGEQKIRMFTVDQIMLSSGLLHYSIKSGNTEKAAGLLGTAMAESGNIYLNEDAAADLSLELAGGMLYVTNLNFIEPDYSNIAVWEQKAGGNLGPVYEDVFLADKNKSKVLYFAATSSNAPEVSAEWGDETALSEEEFTLFNNLTNDTTTVMKFNWTPQEEKPYSLTVTAIVGDKETTQEYWFGVNGVLVKLNNSAYPSFIMKKAGNNQYDLMYDFKSTTQLQPFSLPCGQINLKNNNLAKNIRRVYTFNKVSQQWMENVPSEFSLMSQKRGYLVELKNNSQLSFKVSCDMTGTDIEEWLSLPSLNSGWNMLGIGGYKTLSIDALKEKLAIQGFTLSEIYEVSTINPGITGVTELSPGKVYWLNLKEP